MLKALEPGIETAVQKVVASEGNQGARKTQKFVYL